MNSLTLSFCCFFTPLAAVHQKGEWFSLSSTSGYHLFVSDEWRDGSVRRRPRAEDTGPCCTVTLFSSDTPSAGWLVNFRSVIRSGWPSAGCVKVSCFVLQYLTCLKTSRSMTDKLSFDVGLQEDSTGEAWLFGVNLFSQYVISRLQDDLESSDDLCFLQVRPVGGRSIPRLNRDPRGRKCVSEMISFSSAFHRSAILWVTYTLL